ncbi:carbohydrate porin [Agrobacterium rhizogenes]|uniref:carbohydrate porin n=1 Tax=Rhizobium rhizogenes TaxID=359 RepID=UPI000DDE3A96|nr:carbohydrate porin [Rhizobium rhizogenes]KAA6487797.1 porin [Agrobacterium sp. ICMP 7243]NTF83899.1 carbohydrate porin [Rhizobium rhizogenes]NTG03300.1 carbohydrate porin [Rhizobium rhizogenes]NTG16782.1 carbohydrate porin [Rhizobium rhizogenes]NTG23484.1 carbohydrate porin [Rhizobium rhizogenes]
MRILYFAAMPLLLAVAVPASAAGPAIVSDEVSATTSNSPEPQFSGPLAKLGRTLHDNGVDIGLSYVNLYMNTPNFGFTTGASANYGMFLFDTKVHLSDYFQVNFQETLNFPSYNVDSYLFDLSNAFFPVPVVDSDTDLTRLTVQGNFFDGRLEIEGGRMGLNQQFIMQGFCGGIGCLNSTSAISLNIPGASLSEWGGRIGYKLSPETKLGFGIIEDNPDNWQNGSGWDWSKGEAKGYISVANVTHDETFKDHSHPLRYEIGAYHSSSPYDDALYNSGWGNPTFMSASPTIIEHKNGTTGIYAQGRKVIWSNPSSGPLPENIALYGGVFRTFGDGQAYPLEAYAGVEYSGFWERNPIAGIGATVHYINLSKKRSEYERNARLFFSGIDQAQPRDMFEFDLHGKVGVTKNGILELGAAYIVNPNTSALADYSTGRQKDGFMLYATLVFDIGSTLGLSPSRVPE